MAGRKSLPDIMGDVLTNEPKFTNQQVDKSINKSIDLSTNQQNSENTIKITFYMAENIASDMEDLWHFARKITPAEDKSKLNRSVIGQELISFALNSLKDEKEKKLFVDKLVTGLKSN
ncbi:MAG: hypothetical protein FD167_1569 [bacterium]|nr:MAG: hypothetical protein FD167_1569 [bacterium]